MKRLALWITAGVLAGCSSPPPSAASTQTLPVLTVSSGAASTYQDYPASVDGVVDVEIRPQVSGILQRVYVDEGAYVHAGDPLFRIDEAPYREKLNNAVARLHAAEGSLINAQLEVDKLTPLVEAKVVADIQLRTAKSSAAVVQANIEQAKADIATAQIDVGYTLIKAPVSGYIGLLPKKQGNLVAPGDGMPMTTLSDVHVVHAYFAMGEDDFILFKARYPGTTLADKIRLLPPVTLVLSNDSIYDQKGRIELIDGQFDKNTGAITFRATFPNAQGLLRAGNTGKVRLGMEYTNQVIVPQQATLELQDEVFVFFVGDSNKVSKRAIGIAAVSGNNYLVNDGLKAGDRIVFKGFEHLHEGDKIQPDPASSKAVANLINHK
jgi:membrane fusion protein, multidrug efflux system